MVDSEIHRILGIGRDLESSTVTLLPKQDNLGQTAQEHFQAAFKSLQRRRLYSLSGQPALPESCFFGISSLNL